jgi:hypothetical protein
MRRISQVALLVGLTGCVEYSWFRSDAEPAAPVDTAVEDTGEWIANAPVYANTGDELFEIEPGTGGVRTIGNFWTETGEINGGIVDIAINTQGIMYGSTSTTLYRLHPFTAEAWSVCETDGAMMALAFTAAGELVGGNDSGVYHIDKDSCENAKIAGNSVYETSGDLVGLPDGYLYWTVRGDESDELVRVSPVNGAMRWVGPIGHERLYGLGYDEGTLYGFSADGEIVRIDPDSAATSVAVESSGWSWWGATTNPRAW